MSMALLMRMSFLLSNAVPVEIQKSVVAKIAQPVCDPSVETFSRKCLLLSTYQMMVEGYPLPIKTKGGEVCLGCKDIECILYLSVNVLEHCKGRGSPEMAVLIYKIL